MSSQLLRLNAFRGEPASSGFSGISPNHNSSADSSTSVGSDLHLVSPKLHPGFHVPHATRVRRKLVIFRLLDFRHLECSIQAASPSSTTLVLLSHNPVFTVVSCLPMDSEAVRKVALFGNLRIYAYFQLPEAFRRLLRPSSSLGA
ncbi:hypothetical protein HAX54_033388 [Datura stramonium]|uniref:Uncharacterized protein n=1 Tax=Datura stramonium TaxID=4076 RepID=A0ABS8VFD7_DATST|nr:hypothetical protein [Datura stramonium]